MQILDNTNYKFDRKFTDCDTYQVKITTELLEELENCQNVNEVLLNITGSFGTLTIPSSKCKKSKIFDLNIGPISRGEKESFELNAFRSNKRAESLGSLTVRLNVQATSKVYDMTKKKITEVEDESKKHCAKELKLEKFPNKQGLAYKVIKNKEARKSEASNSIRSNIIPPVQNEKPIDKNEFTIRQKVLHLLAVKPLNKEVLLLRLQKLKVTCNDRNEVEKCLSQLATLNKDNLYQLSNQFIPEIREDWSFYSEEDRRRVSRLKSDSRTSFSNRIPISRHSTKSLTPDHSHENTRPRAILAPHSSKTKITALDMLNKGLTLSEISRTLNVPENVLQSWKSLEHQIRQNYEHDRRPTELSANSNCRGPKETTISPANGNIKRKNVFSHDEDSNSSFKTHVSNDEGFVSGDKRSPLVKSSYLKTATNKRRSQYCDDSISHVKPDHKKIHLSGKNTIPQLSSHDTQSSSSCDVTPKSDISQSSSTCQIKLKTDKSTLGAETKINIKTIQDTQNLYNAAFEEYSTLCDKLKAWELKIENLRSKCKNGLEDHAKLFKLAKLLLVEMETPEFQLMTGRVIKLESDMFEYLKILSHVQNRTEVSGISKLKQSSFNQTSSSNQSSLPI